MYICERTEPASLEFFFAFLHSKTAISFNILLVLQILCRYKWHACRLTNSDKFPNVPTKLWKSIIGREDCPPYPPPPPPATLMAGNAKEADIWFGRESAREARGKFKDLVCLVVFLCWIKRFVLLSLCLKCKYMNRYFSSFQKSRGGKIPPRKIRGGDPPVPPGIAAYGCNHTLHSCKW